MNSIWIRTIVSVLAVIALIVHVTKWRDIQFGWESLVLIAIALVPWLSEFVASFKLGKDSIELELREIEKKADAAIDASLRGVAKAPALTTGSNSALAPASKAANNDDPQKGKWGGNPASNGRLLTATVEKIPNESYFRRVLVSVSSTDPSKPLTGKVRFHLHPTFDTPEYEEPVKNGIAQTSLISYGAFTIGAEADNGQTKLELDLSSLDDQKDMFFKR